MFRFVSWKSVSALVALVAAVASVTALVMARPASAQVANTLAVDADASTAAVDTARTVSNTSAFTLGVNMTAAGTPYAGYQVELAWPDAGLDFVSATQLQPGSLTLCGIPNVIPGPPTETYQSACARSSGTTTFVGPLETVDLVCASNGVFTVHMVTLAEDPNFGTTTLNSTAAAIPTGTQDAIITCTGAGGGATATPAPATATNTSVPAATNTTVPTSTNTPAPGATNTPIATATNTSVPVPTDTSVPGATATNTSVPTSTNTPGPTETNTAVPTVTNTPTETNTPQPGATNTTVPSATNTSQAPTNTPPAGTATATRTPTPGGECVPFGQKVSLIIGIVFRMGTQTGDQRFKVRYDLDANGRIDGTDLQIAVNLRTCHGNGHHGDHDGDDDDHDDDD